MELPCRPERYANPFSVRLGNSTTVIEIEGVSYGMGASTKVFHAEDADDDWYGLPVWKLMPKLAPEGNTKSRQLLGQREQILRQAADLMEYARDVLSGDFKVLDAIVDHQRQLDEERLARAPSRAQRAANVAVSEAGHAFKRGEYSTVVRLLEPHLALLTPSQKRRYDIARERSVNA
ncbi:MAG: hypothetical protein HGA39_09280 [Coriobacteriia bacterium]|nr:hypothetical protein [Coriobacteriia bacterium]